MRTSIIEALRAHTGQSAESLADDTDAPLRSVRAELALLVSDGIISRRLYGSRVLHFLR